MAEDGTNLLDFLRKNGFDISADCSGLGTCGKCMVEINDSHGKRQVKSCEYIISEDLDVTLRSSNGGIIESGTVDYSDEFLKRSGYGAAVDLGTTTICVSVFDLESGALIGTSSDWNAQGSYGADVISRVDYCMKKPRGLEMLGRKIRRQIRLLIQQIIDENGGGQLSEVVISGNTVMQHIFAQIDPSPMAKAPYEPSCLFDEDFEAPVEYPEFDDCMLGFSPCIAGFVGGDIVSGILASGMDKGKEISLLLDIGTNGEMVIGNSDSLLCCSVATGPAFEGAHLSCGMRSADGAISHISLTNDLTRGGILALKLDIIGDQAAPLGLCGTAYMDLLAILLDEGVVDSTGRLLGPGEVPLKMRHFVTADDNDNGIFWVDPDQNIYVNAADIRQLQLAKAAVAAGIDTLLDAAGISADCIDKLYIAGGFGKNLNPYSVSRIGLIPEDLTDKITDIGNASLTGATALLRDPAAASHMLKIADTCKHLELALDKGFSEKYIEQMTFN